MAAEGNNIILFARRPVALILYVTALTSAAVKNENPSQYAARNKKFCAILESSGGKT
jgi:hypothetical protein